MQYDYHSCPYEPDTGVPPCGEKAECKTCAWCVLADNPHNGGNPADCSRSSRLYL